MDGAGGTSDDVEETESGNAAVGCLYVWYHSLGDARPGAPAHDDGPKLRGQPGTFRRRVLVLVDIQLFQLYSCTVVQVLKCASVGQRVLTRTNVQVYIIISGCNMMGARIEWNLY